jgi:methionyl-tRNA synthetase
MLSFTDKRFDGRVPEPSGLEEEDQALLEKVEADFQTVGEYTTLQVPRRPFDSLRAGSAGLDRKAPWFQTKED